MREFSAIYCFCLFFTAVTLIRSERLAVSPLVIGYEYNITFDDGEVIRNGKILTITDTEYEIQIRGLTEKIKVERATIVSASPVADRPKPQEPKKARFRRWDIHALADMHLGLAAFSNFDSFFPAAGLGLNAQLYERLPYLPVNAFHTDLTFMQIGGGDRTIMALNAVVTARFIFSGFELEWYGGAGGGIAGLSLKSYSFSRTSYAMLGRVEFGVIKRIGAKWLLNAGVTGTYWQDNLELLMATSGQVGIGFIF